MDDQLKEVHIPKPVYEDIVWFLECLRQNYAETEMEALGIISRPRLDELAEIVLLRDQKENDKEFILHLGDLEALHVLHACHDVKNFFNDIGGEKTLGMSLQAVEGALQNITPVLGKKSAALKTGTGRRPHAGYANSL